MIPNLRDVGASVNQAAGRAVLREGVLWRSGKLDHVASPAELGFVSEVINLREEGDPVFGAKTHHLPLADTMAVYEVSENLPWLSAIHAQLARSQGPVLVHCTAGIDRSGVAIASVLSTLGVDPAWILADYQRSPSSHPERMAGTLKTLAGWESPLRSALRLWLLEEGC